MNNIFEKLKGKRVLLYGAGEGFVALDKIYDFKSKLNVVGIADLKFEKNTKKAFKGYKKVSPKSISDEEFDAILVTNEGVKGIIKYLKEDLNLYCEIQTLFVDDINDERANFYYLYKYKFDKTLPILIKNLKGKKVILYGAGKILEVIDKYFDLSGLDIIAIADARFKNHKEDETFLGRKVCDVDEIKTLNPDLVLISTKYYMELIHMLRTDTLRDITVIPLIKKSFFTLFKEAWTQMLSN